MTDVAIVVGASSGLGAALYESLRKRMAVVGVARRGPEIRGDAALPETAKAAVDEARRRGTLNLLINCAGTGVFKPAGTYSPEDVATVFTSNVATTLAFCQAIYPLFRQQGSGTIVNVMSTAALVGKAGETIYCGAKWAVRGFTEALRVEAKGTGVRVVGVYPGGMKTAFWKGDPRDVGGFMEPADVASAIVDAIFQKVGVTELTISRC